MALKMDKAALEIFVAEHFPQVDGVFHVESVSPGALSLRMVVDDSHLRPGGTVSGPSMFGLADVAFYLAVLAMIGPKALTVTTHCSIDFMRKPAAGRDLFGAADVLKLGRSLAVGTVTIRSDGMPDPVAFASLTYAIPPDRST